MKSNLDAEFSKKILNPKDITLPKSYWKRATFIKFLEQSLIPDLRESGMSATAEDFETAVFFIKNPKAYREPAHEEKA